MAFATNSLPMLGWPFALPSNHIDVPTRHAHMKLSSIYPIAIPIPLMSGFPEPHNAPHTLVLQSFTRLKSPPVALRSRSMYAVKSVRVERARQPDGSIVEIGMYQGVRKRRSKRSIFLLREVASLDATEVCLIAQLNFPLAR